MATSRKAVNLFPDETTKLNWLLRQSRAGTVALKGGGPKTRRATTVICTDKTGTLTENRIAVASLLTPPSNWTRPTCKPLDVAAEALAVKRTNRRFAQMLNDVLGPQELQEGRRPFRYALYTWMDWATSFHSAPIFSRSRISCE